MPQGDAVDILRPCLSVVETGLSPPTRDTATPEERFNSRISHCSQGANLAGSSEYPVSCSPTPVIAQSHRLPSGSPASFA
ncbi:unnamed protein product [Parajaminaea phylloscopi]